MSDEAQKDGVAQVRVKVYGVVQGVGFRFLGRHNARALGLTGWIRNCSDNSVETVAQGPPGAIDDFLAWLQHGPSSARVDRIEPEWIDPPDDRFASFEAR